MLLGVLHLLAEQFLQHGQRAARLFQFDKPSLTVRHTGDAVGHTGLRHTAELVGVTAQFLHTLDEIFFYFLLGHGLGITKHFLSCNTFFVVYGGGSTTLQ